MSKSSPSEVGAASGASTSPAGGVAAVLAAGRKRDDGTSSSSDTLSSSIGAGFARGAGGLRRGGFAPVRMGLGSFRSVGGSGLLLAPRAEAAGASSASSFFVSFAGDALAGPTPSKVLGMAGLKGAVRLPLRKPMPETNSVTASWSATSMFSSSRAAAMAATVSNLALGSRLSARATKSPTASSTGSARFCASTRGSAPCFQRRDTTS